ncbi:MAG: hypothetical protein VCA55_07185 [Verrucomicrobiales bacterium]|jgi:hypothetical protein
MADFASPPNDNDPDREGIILLEDDGRKHLWDNPANVRRFLKGFFIACVLLFLLDGLFLAHLIHKHLSFGPEAFPLEGWAGFFSVYGFIACTSIVLLAKQLRKAVMRPEDYYDK